MYSINNIDKELQKIQDEINARMIYAQKLIEYKQNIEDFNARYADLIGGPDGIFGALSDEVFLHILSYMRPIELLEPPCSRFYYLRGTLLRERTYSVSRDVIDGFISTIFIHPIVFHVAVTDRGYIIKRYSESNAYYIDIPKRSQHDDWKCRVTATHGKSKKIEIVSNRISEPTIHITQGSDLMHVKIGKYGVLILKNTYQFMVTVNDKFTPVILPGIMNIYNNYIHNDPIVVRSKKSVINLYS
jgi:hypothetical protein